eukprot:80445-Pyramimonas_sp.AAC.1
MTNLDPPLQSSRTSMDRNVRGSTERLRSPVRSRREDSKPEAAPKVRPPPSPPIMSAVAPK